MTLQEKIETLEINPTVFLITPPQYMQNGFAGEVKQEHAKIEGIQANIINPTSNPYSNKDFFDLIHKLDGISYESKDMAAPKWVFTDFMYHTYTLGIGTTVEDAKNIQQEKVDKLLQEVPKGYNGIIPLSLYSAVVAPKELFGNTLASIYHGKGLGALTKQIGIAPWKHKKISGFIQANNASVKTHSKISPLQLVTPDLSTIHGTPLTMKYTHAFNQEIKGEQIHIPIQDKKALATFLKQQQVQTQNGNSTTYIQPPGWQDGNVTFAVQYHNS